MKRLFVTILFLSCLKYASAISIGRRILLTNPFKIQKESPFKVDDTSSSSDNKSQKKRNAAGGDLIASNNQTANAGYLPLQKVVFNKLYSYNEPLVFSKSIGSEYQFLYILYCVYRL